MARSEAFKHSCYLSTSCNRWEIHENTLNFDGRPLERMKETLDTLDSCAATFGENPSRRKTCRVGLSCGRVALYRHVAPTYRHVAPTKSPVQNSAQARRAKTQARRAASAQCILVNFRPDFLALVLERRGPFFSFLKMKTLHHTYPLMLCHHNSPTVI